MNVLEGTALDGTQGNMVGPNGEKKAVKVGFSWTMLFFNFWVPALRGDIKWAVISFFACFPTFGIAWFVFPFIYNKIYINGLTKQGFKPETEELANLMRSKGIAV